jgi:hypothetical protein
VGSGGGGGAVEDKWREESSFFEKKEAKKLLPVGAGSPHRTAPCEKKFFASFFQKRSLFLAAACLLNPTPRPQL